MNYFTGIDVGKKRLDVAWLRDPFTSKKKTKKFDNTALGHKAVAEWLIRSTKGTPGDIVVTIEPTGIYHESLTLYLYQCGFSVLLVNPGKAKKYAQSRGQVHKTDQQDGIMLARYGESNHDMLSLWQPEPEEARKLKVLLRRLDALEKDLQREYNRKEATDFSLSSDEVTKSLQQMIDTLKVEIQRLKEDIDEHIDNHPQLKKNRDLLESIKGIGEVVSREMLCLLACKQFKNARQVSALLGLIPRHRESGTLKGRTTLSKVGDSRLRAKLYMAAVVASTHNIDIRHQKRRLLDAGKTKMQALCAAMRKLVQICFGVIKHQSQYQPKIQISA